MVAGFLNKKWLQGLISQTTGFWLKGNLIKGFLYLLIVQCIVLEMLVLSFYLRIAVKGQLIKIESH